MSPTYKWYCATQASEHRQKAHFVTIEVNDLIIIERESSCVYAYISVPSYHHSNVKIAVSYLYYMNSWAHWNEVFVVVYNQVCLRYVIFIILLFTWVGDVKVWTMLKLCFCNVDPLVNGCVKSNYNMNDTFLQCEPTCLWRATPYVSWWAWLILHYPSSHVW